MLELEGIASEYEADLMYYQQQEVIDSDSDPDEVDGIEPLRPLRNFPAVALITAIHSTLEVCVLHNSGHGPPVQVRRHPLLLT